ncbi:hypothetical protein HPP92_004142 [Vanilla planifolia]|uniref:Uncharacterized protein n=1 Tax=Vanilla planifolia TaxID=51239 RepID=A0A835VK29_VANPL|nr:hypothetical protein HPP92_004142 [Vanilla planifolia]
MGMGRVVVLVAYAVLFVLATPRNSGGWLAAHGFSVATSSDAEEEKVEQETWSDCRMKSIVGALNLLKPDENPVDSTSLYLKKQTSLREDLQESLHHLSFGMKHSLLECLISKDRFVRLVLQNAPTNRQPRKLARSRDQQLPRRHLLGKAVDTNVPWGLLHYSQASPGGAKDSPLQDNNEVTLHEDSTYLSPAPSPGGYLKPVGTNPAPRHVVMQSEQKSNKRTVIIAVVVTASVTFTLSAICFFCFYRYLWEKYLSDKGKRDERPLLSLSLNDFSGSSHVSFGLGNSIKKHGSLFFKADSLDSPSDTEINEGHATIST